MKYYDLKEGSYNRNSISEDELWDAFSWLFHKSASNDTSYKFIFFSAIMDCVEYGKTNVTFDVLFDRFCYYSWPLIIKYNIRQKAKASDGRMTELENRMREFYNIYCHGCYTDWNQIPSVEKDRFVKKIIGSCKRYVVGAFFGDTKELFYSFSRKEEWIEINPIMARLVKKNIKVLRDLNYNKWAKFYENKNDLVFSEKLRKEIDTTYVRQGENIYRTILANEYELIPDVSKENQSNRTNTLELLFSAEASFIDEEIDSSVVEEELYKDINSMTEYLKDPILLLNKIKEEKGILI